MKIFVTGASGFIGRRFCYMAMQAGHSVSGLVRPASAGRVLAGVERIYGTLPYDIPKSAFADCDVVLHLAAITTSNRTRESYAVNQVGTEVLLSMAEEAGAAFIFVSTQSAHGGNSSTYAVTKRNSEELVRHSSTNWTIVRPGLVYGPGESGLYGRMKSTVRRLPVIPLLGGGTALVQPVHVDDLSQVFLQIVANFADYHQVQLNIGDPDGVSMKEFLLRIAQATGGTSRFINIPLGPVKMVTSIGEWLRLPLPVSTDNLRGLETVQRMDTASSLAQVGVVLRDLNQGMIEAEASVENPDDDRISVLLIGAGKIAIVHGLQILNNTQMRLAGIVEPNRKAADLFKSMGFPGPYYSSIDDALAGPEKPVAAVIATPAFTHLSIASRCLEQGIHLLVEKPLSVFSEQAREWQDLRERYDNLVVHAGYMAAQFPHLLAAFHAARMNKLGHIYKARAIALQTHIVSSEPVRWEMLREKAGGGAMINFGCHVASILFRLLGWPDTSAEGFQWPIYSCEVEDALAARFSIKSTQCSLLVSWSVPGYARPVNLVELECEHGIIRIENSCCYMVVDGQTRELETQLDYGLPFNMSPDYTGGGFTLEHDSFAGSIRSRENGKAYKPQYMPPIEMAEALRLENWIFDLYNTLEKRRPESSDLSAMGIDAGLIGSILDVKAATA